MTVDMPERVHDLLARRSKLFHGLAEPSRLLLLYALADGPSSVGELSERTGLTQPNTSNHLACLLGCGLVASERRGRFVYYRHADDTITRLLALADQVASDPSRSSLECPRCGSRLESPASRS